MQTSSNEVLLHMYDVASSLRTTSHLANTQKLAKKSGGYQNHQVQGPHLKRWKPFKHTNVHMLQGQMKTMKSSQGQLPVILTRYVYCTSETQSITFTAYNAFGRKSTRIATTPTCTVKALGMHNMNTALPQRLCPSW